MDDDTLTRLAKLLERVGTTQSSLPATELVELAQIGGDGELTVDFRARESLGHPLVVLRQGRPRPDWFDALTPRQQQVALLVADGLSNASIAKRLGVTVGTVKDHVHAILTTSGYRRRSQVAAALAD